MAYGDLPPTRGVITISTENEQLARIADALERIAGWIEAGDEPESEPCTACDGKGQYYGTGINPPLTCPTCHGTGVRA